MTFSERHRNKNGQISRKHGNTLLRKLRKSCGQSFAPGFAETDELKDVLDRLDEPSLSHLHRDHDGGTLDGKIAEHGGPGRLGSSKSCCRPPSTMGLRSQTTC